MGQRGRPQAIAGKDDEGNVASGALVGDTGLWGTGAGADWQSPVLQRSVRS